MKTSKFKNLTLIMPLVITVGVFLFLGIGYADDPFDNTTDLQKLIADKAGTAEHSDKPRYVPDEIIVKFKAEVAVALERQIAGKGRSRSMAQLAASLDKLNKKYKVKRFKQIFPNFKENQKRLEALKKKDKSLLTKNEKHLLRRLKRAPKDAKIPDLDRIYKLELEKGQSIEEAVIEYNQDPNVEYAEPNYIYELFSTPLPDVSYIPNDYYIEDDQNPGYWREGSWEQTYADMWGLQKIKAIEAWNLLLDPEHKPGKEVIVAVIDTGISYDHPDLQANIWINQEELKIDNGEYPMGLDANWDGEVDHQELFDYVGDINADSEVNFKDVLNPFSIFINEIDENPLTQSIYGNHFDDIIGWNFVEEHGRVSDQDGHGTHCAGTIAGVGNNNRGIVGIAPSAKIMALDIDLGEGYVSGEGAAKAMYYAADNGADVLSNSWGGYDLSETIKKAVDYTYNCGCVIVAAAGNDNISAKLYPAAYENVIAVAASDHSDQRSDWSRYFNKASNYGEWIDVAAPGGGDQNWARQSSDLVYDILSTIEDDTETGTESPNLKVSDGYYRLAGTSMACPHVAGLAALIISNYSILGNDEVRQLIRESADDVGDPGFDIYFGYGRINAYEAMLETPLPDGRIFFEKPLYSAPSNVGVILFDADLSGTVIVKVNSTTEIAFEEIALTEIEPDAGIFKGTVRIETESLLIGGDGILLVEHGDALTAVYNEISPPGIKQATTFVDAQGPIITEVKAHRDILVDGTPKVTITWLTDEPSTSNLCYGIDSLDMVVTESAYVTEHSITVTDLDINTNYIFAVESQDIVGNLTHDDNSGDFYQLIIVPPDIEVIPSTLSFEALEGATTPISKTFVISNVAGSESCNLLFELHTSQNWINVSPKEGRIENGSSKEVQLTVNPKGLRGGLHIGEVAIANNAILEEQVLLHVEVEIQSAPAVHYKRYIIEDSWTGTGRSFMVNGDRQFNPGERIELNIEVENFGSLSARNVSATLSLLTPDPYITILDDTIDFGNISAGAVVISPNSFLVEAEDDIPMPHTATFALDIEDEERHIWHEEFHIEILPVFKDSIRFTHEGVTQSMACDDKGNVYLAWVEVFYNYDISRYISRVYFNHSSNYGATWQDSKVQIDIDESKFTDSFDLQMECNNDGRVYVAWKIYDYFKDSQDIYFNYSHDYGATWQEEPIPIPISGDLIPRYYKITCDKDKHVYIVCEGGTNWYSPGNYGGTDIYLNYSSDYGANWQEESIRLDTDMPETYDSRGPDIACNGSGHVYVMWKDDRHGYDPDKICQGGTDIYFNYSEDFGATWQNSDIRLTEVAGECMGVGGPMIACDNNKNVYATFRISSWGPPRMYSIYSNDYGLTWSKDLIPLEPDYLGAVGPRISCDNNGRVYVIWERWRYGNSPEGYPVVYNDVYFNYSHDYGATWQTQEIKLDTEGPPFMYTSWPQLGITCDDNGGVYTVFEDYRGETYDIYFNYSQDYGATWLQDYGRAEVQLNPEGTGVKFDPYSYFPAMEPQICSDNSGNLYVAWRDDKNVNVAVASLYMSPSQPYLSDDHLIVKEGETLEFTVSSSLNHKPLELFFDTKGLPEELRDNIPTDALSEPVFNEETGETTAMFSWTPDLGTAGEYDPVVFIARDPTHGRCSYQAIAITVLPPSPPVADFIATPAAGDVPLTVKFTDQSTGIITSWLWEFGDLWTSTERNPTHTYKYVGTYTVSLTVTGPGGQSEKKAYIIVVFRGRVYNAYSDKDIVMYGDTLNLYGEVTGGNLFTSYAWLCDGRELIRGDVSKTQQEIVTVSDSVDISWWRFTPGTHTIQLKARNDESDIDRYSEPFTITVAKDGKTIQDDIDNALPGDTVYIEAGTYKLTSDLVIEKSIRLTGSDPLDTTILLGEHHIIVRRPLLAPDYQLDDPLDVTIEAMTITDHVYTGLNIYGPIQNYASKLTFKDSRVIENEGVMVSAIYSCPGSKLYLENTLIVRNRTLPTDDVSQYVAHLNYNCYSGTIYLGAAAKLYIGDSSPDYRGSTIADNINDSTSFTITEPQTGYGQTGYGVEREVTVNYGAIHRAHMNYISIIDSIMWNNGNDTDEMRDISQMYETYQRRDITHSDIQQLSILGEGLFDVIHKDPEFDIDYIPRNPDPDLADMGARF